MSRQHPQVLVIPPAHSASAGKPGDGVGFFYAEFPPEDRKSVLVLMTQDPGKWETKRLLLAHVDPVAATGHDALSQLVDEIDTTRPAAKIYLVTANTKWAEQFAAAVEEVGGVQSVEVIPHHRCLLDLKNGDKSFQAPTRRPFVAPGSRELEVQQNHINGDRLCMPEAEGWSYMNRVVSAIQVAKERGEDQVLMPPQPAATQYRPLRNIGNLQWGSFIRVYKL